MPDFGFQDRHVPGLISGDKPFTLRRAWKRGTPDVGTTVGIVTGWRTKARRRVATARITFRCAVSFSEGGIEAFYDWREDAMISGLAFQVKGALQRAQVASPLDYARRRENAEKFAGLDGFEDYAAFWRFHASHRAAGSSPVIQRELIGLGLVVPEFAQ